MLQKWLILSSGRLTFWLLLAISLLITVGINYYVNIITSDRRYIDVTKIPPEKVAIVFGAGVWDDGTPTPMLADRVEAAIKLYKLGKVQKILMTGDNSSPNYNEVKAMQNYAIEKGVLAADVTLDYAGFSTYESCYRAKAIFDLNRAILITQNYHLPRAVYTCNHLGIEAIGLGVADWGIYRDESMRYYTFREIFSTLKAVWEVHITRPNPTFLGPSEKIK